MDFLNEALMPGKIGHFFVLLSLVSSIGATVCYFLSARKPLALQATQLRTAARIFFVAESLSVLFIFGILFYIIANHLFEYKYAWQHSSRSLEMKYLLACFWEGQEGSFLLWSFWHCVLGLRIIKKEKIFEAPVMAVVSFVQVLLATMVAGLHFFGNKIGSNPFVLLRNEMEAPIFTNPNYLSLIKDGNDLNPLLQNYWMVIHPPVLFLGFASVLIPFAYAIAGLWTKDWKGWAKPALPWSLFSVAALGTGIMMGAAWAYESLNFGGYWAWDPVENASLVPWLVLVAGVHTLLIYRHTGNALRTTFLFLILAFGFVLYSTFLTRSGVLGETSVHAFTGEGITFWHLFSLLVLPIVPAFALFFRRYKYVPFIAKEEETSSREFWMFVGSLVFLLSALSIILMTSLPVLNKIIGLFASNKETFKPLAQSEDTVFAYNRVQIFVAVIIGLLTAVTQYLKYGATPAAALRKLAWPTIAAVVIAAAVLYFGNIDYRTYGVGYLAAIWLALACSIYAVVANTAYIWAGLKGSLRFAGGSVSHLGFGLLLTGILISSSKKEVLSYNTSGIFVPLGKESKEKPGENLTLVKGLRTDMGSYWVTYEKDSTHPKKPLWFYHLLFEPKSDGETFTLTPNAFINYKGNEGLMANPDAKHYVGKDVFTYITSLSNDPGKPVEDTAKFSSREVAVNDTFFYSKGYMILEKLVSKSSLPNAAFSPDDSATVATVKVFAKSGSVYTAEPLLINRAGIAQTYPDTLTAEGLVIQLQKRRGSAAELGVKESGAVMQYLTLKAYVFPHINLVWLGTVVMVIGIAMSTLRRLQQNSRQQSLQL